MIECDSLVTRHALVAERHRVGGEILIFVDGGVEVNGMRQTEAERGDLLGMCGEEFRHGNKRMNLSDDTLGDVVDAVYLDGPIKATHHLVGIEFGSVDVDGPDRAHFGEKSQRGSNNVGDVAVARAFGILRMILDIDKPKVRRTYAADVAQAHGLVEIVEVTTVKKFRGDARGLDVELITLAEVLDETVVVDHNNGVLNSVTVTFCL